MEAIAANITASCPSSFGGSAGEMFAQTIAALVAAHCVFTTDNVWPEDRAEELMRRDTDGDALSFDFVIVGAGTAGSLLTKRLSEVFPSKDILLVEAGDDPGVGSEVPLLIFENKENNWSYETEAQESSCRGYINNRCPWPSGKCMGGSSSTNAMLYVRGNPQDYDTWAAMGNPGWGYTDVLPYFKKIENYLNLTDPQVLNEDSKHFYNMMTESWKDLGYESNTQIEAIIGTRVSRALISEGRRKNTAKYFFTNIHQSKNVKVMKKTKASRVIFNGSKYIDGIEVVHSSGYKMIIKVKSEVILSAGAIETPKILMLSGIGLKEHLANSGIPQVLNLPVGQNLQDHTLVPLYFQINRTSAEANMVSVFINYILSKKGPLSHIAFIDFMNFINSRGASGQPDIQYHHSYYVKRSTILKPYLLAIQIKNEVANAVLEHNKNKDLINVMPTLLHPKSRGEILLRDHDPNSPPIIKTNVFTDPQDIGTMIRGIRTAQRLLKSNTLRRLGVQMLMLNISYCSEHIYDSDEYWECYARTLSQSIYHYVGTAKMGSDKTSVVDSTLKVHNVVNLRVVDASVIPIITSANTMSTTLMIAEKAADIIIKEYASAKIEL